MSEYTGNKKLYIKNWYNAEPSQYTDSLIGFPDNETDGLGPDKLYGTVETEIESGYSNNYILNLQSDNMSCSYNFDSTNITSNYMQDGGLMFIMGNDPITEVINIYQADDSNGTNEILIDTLKYPPQITGADYIEDGLHVFYAIIDLRQYSGSQGPYSSDKYYRFTYNVGDMLSSEHLVYANSAKDFGVKLYSSGNWNDNTSPATGLSSAHVIDIKHSGVSGFYFAVPSGTTISRINTTYPI